MIDSYVARYTAQELEARGVLGSVALIRARYAAADPLTYRTQAQSALMQLKFWLRDARPSTRGYESPELVDAWGFPLYGHQSDRAAIFAFIEREKSLDRCRELARSWKLWDDQVQREVRMIRFTITAKGERPAPVIQRYIAPPSDLATGSPVAGMAVDFNLDTDDDDC